ncbi:MAG: tRNA (adenosine(37)-N6)-threonylcarbamoyltransferase complex transferase subunit TsaD [Candidatus Gracilibacteria bacterium]|jgi:N6-L-threonylcarbamoyladenine synthase
MKILGIETSCDETSCAIVEDGVRVLSNAIYSSAAMHNKTGGVVPEVAAREHILKIVPVLDDCFSKANCTIDDIDLIAVTDGPGLLSSLIIGTQVASTISFLKNKKIVPVHHIIGHIYSNWLNVEEKIEFPVLILTVSGGHNELILMTGHNEFKIIGETLDDAAGEAFDKVARILGLGYPGGPLISKAALNGDSHAFKLPLAMMGKENLNFSFSGLKTACLNEVKKYVICHPEFISGSTMSKEQSQREMLKQVQHDLTLSEQFKNDLSASFQETVCETLSSKLMLAYKKYPNVKEVHLAGGVSANKRLREVIAGKLPAGVKFRNPLEFSFCTDNAAMIACAGYFIYQKNPKKYKSRTNIVAHTRFEIL